MGYYKDQYYHFDLENLTEEIVFEELHRIVSEGVREFCTCPVCVQDIAAIVLNRVPPIYCCSMLEKISPRKSLQERLEETREQVRAIIHEAIDTVIRFEHH
ncbi:MAG: late competence development ComFB family protein [Desulfovibrionaceae bacterium]|jgi:competence protein ComFB|nr:late competence development ComFB family protein [Desulfovibrionaceae bacterium]